MPEDGAIATKGADVEKTLLARIESIGIVKVVDAVTFAQAGENIKAIVEVEKAWSGYWASIKESAHKTWKGIVAKEKGPLDATEKKKNDQKIEAKVWFDAEEKKRKEAERIAQEKAQKEADDAALAAAADLEAQGDSAGAEEVISNPPPAPQVIVPTSVPSGYGGMTTKYYSAVVTDIKALAKAVLENKVPLQAIQGNEVFLNGQARMLKKTMNWPGVLVKER